MYMDSYTVYGGTYQDIYPPEGTLYSYFLDGQQVTGSFCIDGLWAPPGGEH